MEQILILSFAAFIASLLTFFSGFGLGTILMPVFAIFFPVEVAIALTGVVHFLNNIFKLLLIGRYADKKVIVQFGITAFLFAFLGAFVLVRLSDLPALYSWNLGANTYHITPIKLTIGILLILFAVIEIIPFMKDTRLENKLPLGGALSGFFGGLSGHQGALRSAFLVKVGLGKEAFIATGVVIACLVDLSRLGVYVGGFTKSGFTENTGPLIAATLSAFAGAFLGSKLIKKVTLKVVQAIVTVMLIILSIMLATGIV